MLPSTGFRLSTYITLAIACAGLGYGESAMLPEVGVFAIVVILALAVIYRLETRVRLLSLSEANRLGGAIALVAILWAGFRVVREVNRGEFEALGWTVFFVSLMAPLLMAAICAKLMRREKHAGDYWFMHAAGLASIVLAGAMAEETGMVVLTAAYALTAVWSLLHFFLARSNGAVPLIPVWKVSSNAEQARLPIQSISVDAPAGRRSRFLFAAIWTSLAAVLALPIYLVTPRSKFSKLDFGQPRIEIGYAADQMIDLTQTGDLRENPETAFEVDAEDNAGRPKEDLNPDQRWRGTVLVTYAKGTWRRDAQIQFPTVPLTPRPAGPWIPPNFGASGYRLTLTVPTKLQSLILADPVAWLPGEGVSVADVPANRPPQAWFPLNNGSVFGRMAALRASETELRYVQYTQPLPEQDVSPPYYGSAVVHRVVTSGAPASIKDYAEKVLAEMVAAGRLPAGALQRDPIRLLPFEQHHEAIARAFRDHLSERPDLVYTTSIKRDNKTVDPVEDFLFYSKAGHCERFATALVLMLRSQGIPAVMVLGFKGCEHTGQGHYLIRQEHAHAWAEALIARGDFHSQQRNWHWLSLDPAPAQAAAGTAGNSGESVFHRGRAAFERYLFHYTPEQRAQAIQSLFEAATSGEFLVVASFGVFAIFAIPVARRRFANRATRTPPHSAQWLDQLLAVLVKHGFIPAPGMTAREFATAVTATLRQRPATIHLAQVPGEWIDAYYESRFGGIAISDDRRAKLEESLDELKRALEQASGRHS